MKIGLYLLLIFALISAHGQNLIANDWKTLLSSSDTTAAQIASKIGSYLPKSTMGKIALGIGALILADSIRILMKPKVKQGRARPHWQEQVRTIPPNNENDNQNDNEEKGNYHILISHGFGDKGRTDIHDIYISAQMSQIMDAQQTNNPLDKGNNRTEILQHLKDSCNNQNLTEKSWIDSWASECNIYAHTFDYPDVYYNTEEDRNAYIDLEKKKNEKGFKHPNYTKHHVKDIECAHKIAGFEDIKELATATHAITDNLKDKAKVILHGYSRGAATIVASIHQPAASIFDCIMPLEKIHALVLIAPFAQLSDAVDKIIRSHTSIFGEWFSKPATGLSSALANAGSNLSTILANTTEAYSPLQALQKKRLTRLPPIILFCSVDDMIVPHASTITLYNELKKNDNQEVWLCVLRGYDHPRICGLDSLGAKAVLQQFLKEKSLPYIAEICPTYNLIENKDYDPINNNFWLRDVINRYSSEISEIRIKRTNDAEICCVNEIPYQPKTMWEKCKDVAKSVGFKIAYKMISF